MRLPRLTGRSGRRALCAASVLFVCGCALIRLPLPVIPFELAVLEDQKIPGVPRVVEGDFQGRPGVIGLVIPLPYLCDLAPLEVLARAYVEELETQYVGELANNVDIREVRIRQVRLVSTKGRLDFIAEAGIRFIGKDETITYWSEFTNRDDRKELVFRPEEPFNVFDLIPGDDECITADLIYSGSVPENDLEVTLYLTLEVEADWQF